MPLEPKAKEYLLKNIKTVIQGLQEQNLDCLKKLVHKLNFIGDLYPDAEWTKELNLVSLSLIVMGATTEGEISRMKKEKADEIFKKYSEKLNDFYCAIEEENIAKTDTFLKEFAQMFFAIIGI